MRDDRPIDPTASPDLGSRTPDPGELRGLAFAEAVRTTLAEVWAHKLRSFLTLIGVILGTGAVVVNITVIEGIKVMIWDGIRGLGFDGVMFVSSQPPEDPVERKKVGLSRGLTQRDVGVLRAGGERLEAVAALRMMETVIRAGGEDRRVRVYGITPSYGVVHGREVTAGRWIDEGDQLESRRVAVLGIELAETLFGNQNPIGRTVRVEETQFRVIGVEGRLGNQFANSGWSRREMNGVLIPLNTFRAYLRGGEQVNILTVKTADLENLELVKSEIERLVRRSHKGVGDFEVENVADEMLRAEKEIRVIIRNWTIVLGSIAGISLLVGGIGIGAQDFVGRAPVRNRPAQVDGRLREGDPGAVPGRVDHPVGARRPARLRLRCSDLPARRRCIRGRSAAGAARADPRHRLRGRGRAVRRRLPGALRLAPDSGGVSDRVRVQAGRATRPAASAAPAGS
jgi:putative ABC transport system permease protein